MTKHVLNRKRPNNILDAAIMDKTHKYVLRLPNKVKESFDIDEANGDTL